MMQSLLQSPYFALFLIVALGFMLGRIQIKGISLDVSAVIFIALLFGHYGVVIPQALTDFGMVLFIFTIGIQAGPGFFDSFISKGQRLVVLSVVIVISALLVTVGMIYLFDLDAAQAAGLLTGALTSTPGLASAKELLGDSTAVAYGIAYPFGVIGVILFVKLLPRVMKVNIPALEKQLESHKQSRYPEISTRTFRITNPNVFGKSLQQLNLRSVTGAVVSRLKHDEEFSIPGAKTVLGQGDYIKAVGTTDALNRMGMFVGEETEEDLPLGDALELRSGLVTNKSVVNVRLCTLNLQKNFNCTITRIRRSGIDLSPNPDLQLKFGDKITFVGQKTDIAELLKLLGNDNKRLSDTDFFPIALGIVFGVLFGKISLAFGTGFVFSFGLTGGILLVSLLLSAIGKTGPIIWTMSGSATQLLRQLGLLLFLAGVGTSAGTSVVETFVNNGWSMFIAGVFITMLPMMIAAFVAIKIMKINMLDLLGALTGGMTSTPGLAAADSMTDTSIPSIAYATVYPVAMVLLILCVQLLSVLF